MGGRQKKKADGHGSSPEDERADRRLYDRGSDMGSFPRVAVRKKTDDDINFYSSILFLFFLSTPAYDYAPNPDKQWILQVTGRMTPTHRQFTDLLMTRRLQTLQSIDDGIEKVRALLKNAIELYSSLF